MIPRIFLSPKFSRLAIWLIFIDANREFFFKPIYQCSMLLLFFLYLRRTQRLLSVSCGSLLYSFARLTYLHSFALDWWKLWYNDNNVQTQLLKMKTPGSYLPYPFRVKKKNESEMKELESSAASELIKY